MPMITTAQKEKKRTKNNQTQHCLFKKSKYKDFCIRLYLVVHTLEVQELEG